MCRPRQFLSAHLSVAISVALVSCRAPAQNETPRRTDPPDCEWAVSDNLFIADANLLTPYRMRLDSISLAPRDSAATTDESKTDPGVGLEFTAEKAEKGGLDLAVLEILVTSSNLASDDPYAAVVSELAHLKSEVSNSATLSLALESKDVTERPDQASAVLIGIENAAFIGSDLSTLKTLYADGVRLMTPVHSRPNQFGDSSYSQERPHRGLSDLGRSLIRAMNETGLIIDVSHMSDESVAVATETTRAPVIASHSGIRHFTPGWERNVDDQTMRRIASTGGVIHIPFSGSFLSQQVKDREQAVWDHVEGQGLSINSLEGRARARRFREEHAIDYASVSDVVAQIDYVVKTVGADHAGIGSSFDGSGDSMAKELKSASSYGRLTSALCEAGYAREDVEKIMGGNFLRVWDAVKSLARSSMLEASSGR